MTRDAVALVVLPVLLSRCDPALSRVSIDRSRAAIVREALAWGDEFMLQKAILDEHEDLGSRALPGRCVDSYKKHSWLDGRCRRCAAIEAVEIRLGNNSKERRHRGRMRRAA